MAEAATGSRLTLRVVRMTHEAEQVVSLVLRAPDGGALPAWDPGAHIDLALPSGHVRQYSLCGDPAEARTYRIGVLRQAGGRGGSVSVHDVLRVGQAVEASRPRNSFALAPASRYLFVAGGIGITPILPMLRQADREGAPWRLFYGAASRARAAFVEELPRGEPGRVHLHFGDAGASIDVAAIVAEARNGADTYLCGPAGLTGAVEAAFAAAGLSGRLHLERFAPSAPAPLPGDGTIRVFLARAGGHVDVPADRSILAALREAGHDLPCSCEQGFCGTCETRVIDGVPDHRDDLLSETERAANTVMMPCVSRARTPTLTLDI